jgi:hypothetical protein
MQLIRVPNNFSETPELFLPTISSILNTKLDAPSHPSLKFELSQEAAQYNMSILKSFGNSIQNLINAHPGSFSPGSEFRPANLLRGLLLHHPNWHLIESSLTKGSVWPVLPILESERIAKNIEFIVRGNHKSAKKYERYN